ncbi:MAG TPA: lycopene cyclase domain-containing protein [Acidimicrobiales bacterium]|nr:lycopene cyclase domain-containing protein [Acidimicrobiales bacterium]
MDRYQYLILMGLCLLITLPLEFLFRARVYRRPRRLLAAMLPPMAVFVVWDLFAIARDHWNFNPRYTTGWELPLGLPVEELSFFVAIPICTLLTLEAVRWGLAQLSSWSARRRPAAAETGARAAMRSTDA